MARVLLIFVMFSMWFCSISAQHIEYDKTESDGTRRIKTDYEYIFRNRSSAATFSLMLVTSKSDSVQPKYYLQLQINDGRPTFSPGQKMLIKLKDGSILEIENIIEVNELDHEIVNGYFGPFYLARPLYQISLEQLITLSKIETEKIRIEHDLGFIDQNVKNLPKKIDKYLNLLAKQLKASTSLYDNF